MALKQLKHMVSKKKRRFQDDGFDLDLSYINDNIIAMGFPAENLEGVYRNHIDDVVRFVESRHKDHYRIYNLCRDRAYNTGKFRDRVVCFPLDDHHPPSLELMKPFCEDVHHWLTLDPENVAVVHCKAGKGRTGVMICAYLLYTGAFTSPDEALDYYGEKRTMDTNGVTIPSQRRYVHYFGRILRERLEHRSVPMLLKAIHFETMPTFEKNGTCSPYFVVRSHDKKMYRSCNYETVRGVRCFSMDINGDESVSIIDDVRIDFFHRPGRLQKREKMFHFWFNTFFVCPGAGSPSSPRNHNRIKPKQSDPEFGARSVSYRQHHHHHHHHASSSAASTPNGTPHTQQGNGCTGSSSSANSVTGIGTNTGGSTSRKDSSESNSTTTSSIVPPRPNRCYSSPQSADSIYACHHVLTLAKNELDVAFKDKTCKRFSANFKVHVVLQCADLSHCPLATKYGDPHNHQPQQQEMNVREFHRRHEKLSEEATDEDEMTSTDTEEEEEEDDEFDHSGVGYGVSGGAGAAVDDDGRLLTAAFCDLCRTSTEALEQTGGYNEKSESSPRESRPNASPRDNTETSGGESGAAGSLLAAPGEKWSNRRSSSPR